MRMLLSVVACILALGAGASFAVETLTPTPPPPNLPTSPPVTAGPLMPSPTPAAPGPLMPKPLPAAPNPPPNTTVTQLSSFAVGNWSGGAYSATGSMAFDHCAEGANYQNGITLVFAVNKTFQWSMGLYDSAWNLAVGTSYPISFTIDSYSPAPATAVVIAPQQVEIPLAPNVALFKLFMEGEQLKIQAAQANYVFNLTKTSQMLPDLLKCVEGFVGAAPASSNPFQ